MQFGFWRIFVLVVIVLLIVLYTIFPRSVQIYDQFITKDFLYKYNVQNKLGKGAFGEVFLVENRSNGKLFALKTIKNTGDGIMNREIRTMRNLNHPNVTQLFDISNDVRNVNMVIEYMGGGSLQDCLKSKGCLLVSTMRFYFLQLCEAIAYLHAEKFTHCDLHPGNILLASHDDITLLKISDFGLTKNHLNEYLTSLGHMSYMPPEYGSNTRLSNKVDIWSLGVIIFCCLSGYLPFNNPDETRLKEVTFRGFWEQAPMDIIKLLLKKNPQERPEATQILEHGWLKDENLIETYNEVKNKFRT